MQADGTPIDIHNPDGFPKVDTFNRGVLKKASHNKADGTTAFVTVPADKVWKAVLIQATFLADANVADRTCNIMIPDIGMGGIAGASPGSLLMSPTVSLSATQYGYLVVPTGTAAYCHVTDNGVVGQQLKYWGCPQWFNAGADIQAKIVTNPQATDKSGIDVLYREYDLET